MVLYYSLTFHPETQSVELADFRAFRAWMHNLGAGPDDIEDATFTKNMALVWREFSSPRPPTCLALPRSRRGKVVTISNDVTKIP